ncbi:Hypothetical predicted protein, partial [Paramuricea clavata]
MEESEEEQEDTAPGRSTETEEPPKQEPSVRRSTRMKRPKLMSIIKTLQTKVTEEAMDTATLELRIREEVTQEMNEQIYELQNIYSNRLAAVQNFNEEVLGKRVEILQKSMQKSRRRKRIIEIIEDSDDEYISSNLYHREQMKVEEQAEIIECMKETIEKQNDIISGLREEVATGDFVPCTREASVDDLTEPPSQEVATGDFVPCTREAPVDDLTEPPSQEVATGDFVPCTREAPVVVNTPPSQ